MSQSKNGAVVYAKNPTPISRFYEGVFTLKVTRLEHDYVVLESPTFQLTIQAIPRHIASSIEVTVPPTRRMDFAVKLAFPVENIAAARSAAGALGGEIDAAESEWEFQVRRICDGHDPERNVVQLYETVG